MGPEERIELIRELCAFEGRRSGTDAERRAANALAARLRRIGRRAEVEPIYVHPQLGLVGALHCVGGIAGSVVAIAAPAVGFGLVLAVAISWYLDLTARVYLLRRLIFRRASQNVVSPGNRPDAPARLVLCAHYDAGRSGTAYRLMRRDRALRALRAARVRPGPFRLLFWSLAALLVPLGLLMAGIEGDWLSVLQLVPTLILLGGAFLLLDIEASPVSPAANDNASGVATTLSLAAELEANPPASLDVWLLLSAAEESIQEGIRAFLRSHRGELDPASTYFICLDAVGRGRPRYETRAGWVVGLAIGGRLAELSEAIAAADPEREGLGTARPLRRWTAGDSLPPRLRRLESITITCRDDLDRVPELRTLADLPDGIDPDALELAHDFALELVRALDADVSRRDAGSLSPAGTGGGRAPEEGGSAEPGRALNRRSRP